MQAVARMLSLILLAMLVGCATGSKGTSPGLVLLVPGAGGDGSWYAGIDQGLRDAGEMRTIDSLSWGIPGPGFLANFNNKTVHASAEKKLAEFLIAYRKQHPTAPLHLIAHSAGCGVTLGALSQLNGSVQVDGVVLLQPSVSPTFDLNPALQSVSGSVNVFYSSGDTTFLKWRVSTFGTYDGIKTPAAGHVGFASPPDRVTQHAWSEDDQKLNHDGSHFGPTARTFVRERIAPLCRVATTTREAAR
jgi:pimeloyl-ACP methyl ester carboxylesterase